MTSKLVKDDRRQWGKLLKEAIVVSARIKGTDMAVNSQVDVGDSLLCREPTLANEAAFVPHV